MQPALNLNVIRDAPGNGGCPPVLLTIAITESERFAVIFPLVMAALMLFAIGSMVTHAMVKLFWNSDLLFKALPDPRLFVWLWSMTMALPAGYLCWLSLSGLARGYRRKSFSDIQMVVDSWMFVAVMFMLPWTPGPTAALLGLLVFVAYRLVVAAGLALSAAGRRAVTASAAGAAGVRLPEANRRPLRSDRAAMAVAGQREHDRRSGPGRSHH